MRDLNLDYPPLPVFNQGKAEDCWNCKWANHLNAWRRIYDGKPTRYRPQDTENWGTRGTQPGFVFHTPDGDMTAGNVNGGPLTKRQIQRAVRRRKILGVQICAADLAAAPQDAARLPVLYHSTTALDHDGLLVGLTWRGAIFLNSWGTSWGYQGRAVLSWQFLANCSFDDPTYLKVP